MTPTDPHLFGRQIFHVSRAWRAELDRRLSHLGLSQARWQVLLNLARMKGVQPTQRELAQRISIEGPTLALLLDGLEKQGLVKRLAVTEDRRAKRIMLTQEAGPLIEKIETIAEALRKELLSGLDDEEIAICQQVHQRVLANLERG